MVVRFWPDYASGMSSLPSVGELLRDWRQRRRLSQLALSVQANVSTRHLSFVESGRSAPSRDMVLHLAEQLQVPLRERNQLLLAAGFAPGFEERSLNDPELASARHAVSQVLDGHEPYPAIAIDRHWNLVLSNRAVPPLLAGCAPELLQPAVNVLRLSLHPQGLAPRIENLGAWREHLLVRLARDLELSGDEVLAALLAELQAYPAPKPSTAPTPSPWIVPLCLRAGERVLRFISTTTVFGSPREVSLSELAIEAFFPADAQTAELLGRSWERRKRDS